MIGSKDRIRIHFCDRLLERFSLDLTLEEYLALYRKVVAQVYPPILTEPSGREWRNILYKNESLYVLLERGAGLITVIDRMGMMSKLRVRNRKK